MDHLDTIGLKHGTDKASNHHGYLSFYEIYFSHLRNESISIMEIGVLGGASLKTWEEYFPNARIVGADINLDTKRFEGGRIGIEILDQSNIEELVQTALKHGPFDIIIEDGSHMWEHQITTLRTLFPFLKDGGYYIVEDLQTNFGAMQSDYKGVSSISCVEYLKKMADIKVGGSQVDVSKVEDSFLRTYSQKVEFINFFRHGCLIKKQFPVSSRVIAPGSRLSQHAVEAKAWSPMLLAHVGNVGDTYGNEGYVNIGPDLYSIQGFSIFRDNNVLSYRVLEQGSEEWSNWCEQGEYAGTRNKYKPIVGFTVRVKSDFQNIYNLRVYARFAGSPDVIEVADGQDCVSDSRRPVCGIQIELISASRSD